MVLVRPSLPDNIGAAARVVRNMGLGRLIVIRPKVWNLEKMLSLAVRLGREVILSEMELATTLEEGLQGFGFVVGTSSRLGRFRQPSGPPRQVMTEAAGLLAQNPLALVFGPEKDGLTNDEVMLCQRLVQIPAAPKAASLNLAQAVMIVAYELRLALLDACREERAASPRLAPSGEIEGMYRHLDKTMTLIDPQGHLNRRVWLEAFRRLLDRTHLKPHEVKLIRGMCRKITYTVRAGEGN